MCFVCTRTRNDLNLRSHVHRPGVKIHSSDLRTLELHIIIFIKQQQQACRAHPRPGRPERTARALSQRERKGGPTPRLQQTREKQSKHITQDLYR